jgi:hypothetical protein
MFWLFRPASSPHIVYSSSLASLGLGHALWYLEPHDTGELQIGDVGYIRDGSFVRLLNIDSSKPEHQVTHWDEPFEVTEPLPPGAFRRESHVEPIVPGHYCSHGVEQREVGASVNA